MGARILGMILAGIGPLCLCSQAALSLPAFPGAQGFGSTTAGGRGGAVFIVTKTADDGSPGTLRHCIAASGPRTCVFAVGGTITLSSTLTVSDPHLTVAGQSAPGGGITIKADGRIGMRILTHDVVIRYLTIRVGSGGQTQAMLIAANGSPDVHDIVIDHCSLSWATDEVLTTWYRAHDITASWNIVSEGLDCSTHPKGCHSKGSLLGGYASSEAYTDPGAFNITAHHNLYAHQGERGPMLKGSGQYDIVNNVSYNLRWSFSYFDFTALASGHESKQMPMKINYVGNYFKRGPDSEPGNYEINAVDNGGPPPEAYVQGNIGPNRTTDSDAQDLCVKPSARVYIVATPFSVSQPVTATSAAVAFADVLADAGNSAGIRCDGKPFSRRDAVDARVVADVSAGTGAIIDDESDVGGWVAIAAGTPCTDSDSDGMPDVWENAWSLDPYGATDGNQDDDGDGYTNLEEYLNGTPPAAGIQGDGEVAPIDSGAPSDTGGAVDTALPRDSTPSDLTAPVDRPTPADQPQDASVGDSGGAGSSGCSCEVGSSQRFAWWWAWVVLVLLLPLGRRTRRVAREKEAVAREPIEEP